LTGYGKAIKGSLGTDCKNAKTPAEGAWGRIAKMQKHRLGDFGGGARFLQKGNCSRQNKIYYLAVSSETTRPTGFCTKTSTVPDFLWTEGAAGRKSLGSVG
jgi:hypothetical protein